MIMQHLLIVIEVCIHHSPTETVSSFAGQYALKNMIVRPLLSESRCRNAVVPYSFKHFMLNSSTIVRHSKYCTQSKLHSHNLLICCCLVISLAFYRAALCISAVFAVARCPSICLSVRHVRAFYRDS